MGQLSLWRQLYTPEDPAAPRPRSPIMAPPPLQRTQSCDSLNSDTSSTLGPPLSRSTLPPPSSSTPTPTSNASLIEEEEGSPLSNGHAEDEDTADTPGCRTPRNGPVTHAPHEEAVEEVEAGRHAIRELLLAEEAEERRESFTEDPLWAEAVAEVPPTAVSTSTSDISDSLVRRDAATIPKLHVPVRKRERRRRRKDVADWLDLDGLPAVRDAVQDRVRHLTSAYQVPFLFPCLTPSLTLSGRLQRRMAKLESEVQRLRFQLKDSNGRCPANGHGHADPLSNVSPGGGFACVSMTAPCCQDKETAGHKKWKEWELGRGRLCLLISRKAFCVRLS